MAAKKQELSFEEALEKLEAAAAAIQNEGVSLEESLKLFREGTELVRNCNELLENAQLQVKMIMTAADGSPVEEEFPHDI